VEESAKQDRLRPLDRRWCMCVSAEELGHTGQQHVNMCGEVALRGRWLNRWRRRARGIEVGKLRQLLPKYVSRLSLCALWLCL